MKSLAIVVGIAVAVAVMLVFATVVFDDFAIYLCDPWLSNACIKIWEDPDCHRPGSGCIMLGKIDSEQLRRILDYCNVKGTGIAMIQPRWTYSNDTHYVDNENCTWEKMKSEN